ncbi:MAG: MFS transporter [Bdellovibrionales bacterium]|nr:MFS transporter [Bdellovibrionales bacterium]
MTQKTRVFSTAVLVAALGYFVDIYDLLMFSIVRVESLRSIGYTGRELEVGAYLNNIQMTGLMIGGIAWGMLGDRRGRLSVLFGSIALYSIANFLNAYANNFTQYAFCRFFAGLGLAGELGAGITLVSEVLPAQLRGYGTMIVATVGVTGAIVGGWVVQLSDWRTAFQVGGVLGFLLLILRIGVAESGIFEGIKHEAVSRGNFLNLILHKDKLRRFGFCILAGVPIWMTIGVLVAFAPEFAKNFGVAEPVSAAKAVMYCYLGFVFGDFLSGSYSQVIKSRNRALRIFVVLNFIVSLVYLFGMTGTSATVIYVMCVLLGTTGGYWAVVVTMASEQFGTNLRATATTAVPNFIRFALVPMNLGVLALKENFGLVTAALIVSTTVSLIALFSAFQLKETFGRDLNFTEK